MYIPGVKCGCCTSRGGTVPKKLCFQALLPVSRTFLWCVFASTNSPAVVHGDNMTIRNVIVTGLLKPAICICFDVCNIHVCKCVYVHVFTYVCICPSM